MSPATQELRREPQRSARSRQPTRLLERQSRIAREDGGGVAVAEIDQEVRFNLGAGKKSRIDLAVVEAGHRAAVKTQRARSNDEVSPLQRAIAKRGHIGKGRIADKPGARIDLRKERRQVLVELEIVGNDHR